MGIGPIVYRLGHRLFKARSAVRLRVGSSRQTRCSTSDVLIGTSNVLKTCITYMFYIAKKMVACTSVALKI